MEPRMRVHQPPAHRTRTLLLSLAALIVATGIPTLARAQDHCLATTDVSDAALAARYAPVVRFAPAEPNFPTVPFFYAMDGVDNDGDGAIDFDDPDEIVSYPPGDTLPSWQTLSDWYDEEFRRLSPDPHYRTPVAPLPAVHYRVKTLTEKEQDAMRRFLKQDIMMWSRATRSDVAKYGLMTKPFKVVEYYSYYVNDRGLVGHPQDIEFMFVFVPAQAIVAKFLGTFKEFPPRQKPASFSVGDALSHLQTATQGR